jgi:hypothetical protein
MQRSSRVDYDAIAPLYDSQPHREKSPDPALAKCRVLATNRSPVADPAPADPFSPFTNCRMC